MSTPASGLRRADLSMDEAASRALLSAGYSGHLGTVGADGWPYVVPLLYTCRGSTVYLHGARAAGHLRRNLDHEPRVCFVVDEPGEVYAYGRFACDSSVSYGSVMVFGTVRVVDDADEARAFCDALMAKYGPAGDVRPRGFYPRLDQIAVYALEVERLSGKRIPIPSADRQWPAIDRTTTPHARPPADRNGLEGEGSDT